MKLKAIQSQSKVPTIAFADCYAKTDRNGNPGMSVLEHCRIAGYVARALLGLLPDSMRAKLGDNPVLAVAMHDVGKVSPGFQLKYFRPALSRLQHPLASVYTAFETNHAAVGELTLCGVYGQSGSMPAVAQVAGSHHGSRQGNLGQSTDEEYRAEGDDWPRQRRLLISELENEFGKLGRQPQGLLSIMLLTGLTCVADWIASDENFFDPAGLPPDIDLEATAMSAVQACGWNQLIIKEDLAFADLFGFAPYPMQQAMIDHVTKPGVYILEAPTGMGKTEAALFAAYRLLASEKASGIYFGLPTRLTSDRIHSRVEQFLGRISECQTTARLAHGTAWLSRFNLGCGPFETQGMENDPAAWFNPLKRALLYPFAVGTIDQALLGVLNVKHFFLRLFGLAGKVVVLDEVHTYDMFTGTHLDELVSVLRQLDCTVIILSATLTSQRRTELLNGFAGSNDNYPLLSSLTSDGGNVQSFPAPKPRQVRVNMVDWNNDEVAQNASIQARKGASVLCIANTVAQAQAWFCAVKAHMEENAFDVGLLHSKFTGENRASKEAYWMERLGKGGKRAGGCVLVATQVVEQSVDIDADYLITELAPTDMLIQRLGRLWRHSRTNRPVAEPCVAITGKPLPVGGTPDDVCEALGIANTYVYSPYVLCRTRRVWETVANGQVTLPDTVRSLLADTYDNHKEDPEAWTVLKDRQLQLNEKLTRRARAMQTGNAGMPVLQDDEHTATRYNDRPMRTVLLARSTEIVQQGTRIEMLSGKTVVIPAFGWDIHAVAELHRNTLSIPAYQVPKCDSPKWLKKAMDEQTLLLTVGSNGQLVADGQPTTLAYDELRGLTRIAECSAKAVRIDEEHIVYDDYEQEEYPYESRDW